ncbi:MAG: sensor histidine kinase, partial [Syntrophothermus sp.]
SIKLIKEFQEGLPAIWVTATEIQQVLFNIIQNSAHALRAEDSKTKVPAIIIRAASNRDHIRIEIEDNGPGIDEKTMSRIFEPFFTTKDVGEGTGLGLSVSYMIITKNHNGTIEVKSAKGIGTTFTIKLPLEKTNA